MPASGKGQPPPDDTGTRFLEKRPSEPKSQSADRMVTAIQRGEVRHWTGPIPQPSTMREYKDIIPDAPERILKLAEDEAAYRREMGRKADRRAGWSMFTAALLTMCGFAISGYALYLHEATTATAVGTGTIITIISAFMLGSKADVQTEREEKKRGSSEPPE